MVQCSSLRKNCSPVSLGMIISNKMNLFINYVMSQLKNILASVSHICILWETFQYLQVGYYPRCVVTASKNFSLASLGMIMLTQ